MKTKMKRAIILAFLAAFVFFSSNTCKKESRDVSRGEASRSARILKEVCDTYWKNMLEERIDLRYKKGLKIEKLPDLSYSYAQSQVDFASAILEKLKRVKPEELSHQEFLSLEILRWEAQTGIDGLRFFWFPFLVAPYSSPLPFVHRVFSTYAFGERENLDDYFALLRAYPLFINGLQKRVEEQFKRGIVIPKEELELVIPFLKAFIRDGQESLFYVKDERLGPIEGVVGGSLKQEFQERAAELINREINPALRSLVNYIESAYSASAPDKVGLWQYPEGREYYRYLIRVHTTLDLSPEDIHQIGLDQVGMDNKKVDEIRQTLGFEGTLDEFRRFLRTDSRFFPHTPEAIEDRLNSYVAAMDGKIDSLFLRKPEAPYGVERLAAELEGAMTFGYYDAPSKHRPKGIYYYNGSKLDERSLLMAEGLIYHELVPGHHFHIAFQAENESLPDFRRETLHNAFNEGWAEYASWLGEEVGLFEDPYSLCGKYLMDMFLSTRLVVDTGMNYLEWPRSRTVQFMRDNLLESGTQVHSESLRYSVDIPGQALGYKLGSLKMMELRKKAQKALGKKFDIQRYHEAILGSGSMPLRLLEKHIDWFIEKEMASSD